MRNFLAVILAILAGLTSVIGLVSWKLSDAIHRPEPIQVMLGSGESADAFKAAVPEALGMMARSDTGIAVVDEALDTVITEASGQVMNQEGFDAAWSKSLELTRTGWLETIHDLRQQLTAGEPLAADSTAAQVQLELQPVADLTLAAIQEAVQQALANVSGMGHVEVAFDTSLDATVATSIPSVTLVTAEQVVLIEEFMTMWPAVLGIAVILWVMAIFVASPGSRWTVWLMTGVLAVLGGGLVLVGYLVVQHQLLAQIEDAATATLLGPLLQSIQDWANPQLLVLMAAGGGVALLGVLGGFIASHRRRSRY